MQTSTTVRLPKELLDRARAAEYTHAAAENRKSNLNEWIVRAIEEALKRVNK